MSCLCQRFRSQSSAMGSLSRCAKKLSNTPKKSTKSERAVRRWLSSLVRLAIIGYQKSFSVFLGRQCRFYPSCSHYALWLFDFGQPLVAFAKSCVRILSCNPLHQGGIDYPTIRLRLTLSSPSGAFVQKHIKYWLIPYKNPMFLATIAYPKQIQGLFVIIKSF